VSDSIVLGQLVDDGPLKIHIPTLVDSRALITGNSGAGKSRLLRRLVEQAFGAIQILVLDPEGEFSTLREKHGFLLAGRGGEMPAEPRAAALMARRLMELRASAVLDLYDLKIGQQRDFVKLFLESLLEMPRDQYRPVLLVIDEAQTFCPERSSGEASSTEAVIALMAKGRKRGLCGIPATQRLSMLHKDAAAQASNNFIGRTTLDVDQKRAAAVLGISAAAERVALRDLPLGTFLAYGPALSKPGVVRFQGGDILTTHPKAGQRHTAVAPPAPAAVRKVAAELADLPAQAEEEIRSLQAAKARVRELEGQLRARPKEKVEKEVVKRVEVSVVSPAEARRLALAVHRMDKAADKLRETVAVVHGVAADLAPALRRVGQPAPQVPPPRVVAPPPAQRTVRAPIAARTATGESIGAGERRVLTAIAQYPEGASRSQLTVLTGYKRSSRDAYISRLRAAGLVEVSGDSVVATQQGIAELGPGFAPLPTGDGLRAYWMDRLPKGEAEILQDLVSVWPHARLRDAIEGYKRSSRDAYLSRLEAKKLIERRGPGSVRASDNLFDERS
jgi:hypothetical protein